MDSRFRQNDGKEWIPAFAGMTDSGAVPRTANTEAFTGSQGFH